jgi:hypothetical protein
MTDDEIVEFLLSAEVNGTPEARYVARVALDYIDDLLFEIDRLAGVIPTTEPRSQTASNR